MTDVHEIQLDRYLLAPDLRRVPGWDFDVLVIGSGAAGCAAALSAAGAGASVAVIAKADIDLTNTSKAQGGMAAVLGPDDDFATHIDDTQRVGCGLCEPDAVRTVIEGGPAAVERLLAMGAVFDRNAQGALDLSREGGHTRARIVHADGDATGREIQRTVRRAIESHPDITRFPSTFAIDLVTDPEGRCCGLLVSTPSGQPALFRAPHVILATGGAGQLYRETTNPAIATGDGVAMGVRAGATVRDLEFFQFHPTCLYIAGAARVLISEIVRGAGGVLRDRDGVHFMPDVHNDADLAPRDVVSRAVFERMVATGDTSVYLDLSDIDGDPHDLFPGIGRTCRFFGIDIARDPVPVRPGAHYMIGGLEVDDKGRTSVEGLWAVGECASSGLHGANRVGSNSLLEALVLGTRAGEATANADALPSGLRRPTLPPRNTVPPVDVELNVEDLTYSLKSVMWRQMGIVRRGEELEEVLAKLRFWNRALQQLVPTRPGSWELCNMLAVAQLATIGALTRTESRGVHHRADHLEPDEAWRRHTTIRPILDEGVVAVSLERMPIGHREIAVT